MTMSLLFAGILLLSLLIPIAPISAPIRIWAIAWALCWLTNGLFSYGFYQSEEIYSVVFLGNILFLLGGVSYDLLDRKSRAPLRERVDIFFYYNRVRLVLWPLSIAGWIALDFGLRQMGASGLASFFSGNLLDFMRENQASLYADLEYNVPLGIKLSTSVMSFLAIFVGFVLASRQFGDWGKGRNNRYYTLPFYLNFIVYSLALSAATGVRSLMLVAFLFLFFSFLSYALYLRGGKEVIRFKFVAYTMIGIIGFIGWVIFIQSARLGDLTFSRLGDTVDHMRPWFAGYLPALSIWTDQYFDSADLGYGTTLMRAILGPTGIVSGEGFDLRVAVVQIGEGRMSNAMTMFRAMFSDFGLTGSILLCYIWGWASQAIYKKAIRSGAGWIVLLACNYCAIFFSINYWFFAYGARIFGAVGAYIVFKFFYSRFGRRYSHCVLELKGSTSS